MDAAAVSLLVLGAVWLLLVGVGGFRVVRRALVVRARADALQARTVPAAALLAARAEALRGRGDAVRDELAAVDGCRAELARGLLAVTVLRRAWHDALAPLDLLRGL